MRRQNLRIYNVWRKKNNVFFRLFISHFFDKPLFYPAAPFPPPRFNNVCCVWGHCISFYLPCSKTKKSRCRIFLTRHFHENSGKKISKFGKKILNVVIFIFQCFWPANFRFHKPVPPHPLFERKPPISTILVKWTNRFSWLLF